MCYFVRFSFYFNQCFICYQLSEAANEETKATRPSKLSGDGVDSSPDVDSYDFVRNSSAEQSPVMVESVGAMGDHATKEDKENQGPREDCVMADTEEEEEEEDVEIEYVADSDDIECVQQEEQEQEEQEQDSEDVIIGQEKDKPQEEEKDSHPDLRKRRPPKNQKRKARVD